MTSEAMRIALQELVERAYRAGANEGLRRGPIVTSPNWGLPPDIQSSIAALTSPPSEQGAGWRPIESAPKDGSDILGYGRRAADGESHHAIIRWSDLAQIWAVNCMPFYPTHWQALRAPGADQ